MHWPPGKTYIPLRLASCLGASGPALAGTEDGRGRRRREPEAGIAAAAAGVAAASGFRRRAAVGSTVSAGGTARVPRAAGRVRRRLGQAAATVAHGATVARRAAIARGAGGGADHRILALRI